MSRDVDLLVESVRANPAEDAPRLMLQDAMREAGVWDRPHVLALVLKHPDDDGFRLLAADWFDADGQAERAEFVRVQVALAKMPWMGTKTGDPRYMHPEPWESLRRRERELLKVAESWLPYGPFVTRENINFPLNVGCDFGRGFVAEATSSPSDFGKRGDALLAEHPVRAVTLTRWPETHVGQHPTVAGHGLVMVAWGGRHRDYQFPYPESRDPHYITHVVRRCVEEFARERWPSVRVWNFPADAPDTVLTNDVTLRARRMQVAVRVPDELLTTPTWEGRLRDGGHVPEGDRLEWVSSPHRAQDGRWPTRWVIPHTHDDPTPVVWGRDVTPGDVTFETVTLSPDVWREPSPFRLDTRLYRGRCAHCRTTFVTEPVLEDAGST